MWYKGIHKNNQVKYDIATSSFNKGLQETHSVILLNAKLQDTSMVKALQKTYLRENFP